MFTPTPPSSDDEGKGRRRRSPSPRRFVSHLNIDESIAQMFLDYNQRSYVHSMFVFFSEMIEEEQEEIAVETEEMIEEVIEGMIGEPIEEMIEIGGIRRMTGRKGKRYEILLYSTCMIFEIKIY